jgi:hypothetical protein
VSTHPEPPSGPGPWTGAPFGNLPPPQVSRHDEAPSGADRIVFSLASILGGVVIGFAGGAVWAAVADPPMALYSRRGVYFTGEVSYDHRVVVTLWFLVVGLVGGVVGGLVVGWLGRRHGAVTVVAALSMSAAAAGISAWSGIHAFGPDVSSQLADATFGDMIQTALTITSDVAYLGWPIGALAGVLLVTAITPNDASTGRNAHGSSSGSGTVVAH